VKLGAKVLLFFELCNTLGRKKMKNFKKLINYRNSFFLIGIKMLNMSLPGKDCPQKFFFKMHPKLA